MYTAPKLVEYGKSVDLIQGTCGWGTENAYLDKTGYFNYSWTECSPTTGNCNYTDSCRNSDLPNECKTDRDC